jgi:hypothetical protein
MWLMALFTFREAWRKKVALIAAALTLAYLILYGAGLHFITADSFRPLNPNIFAKWKENTAIGFWFRLCRVRP